MTPAHINFQKELKNVRNADGGHYLFVKFANKKYHLIVQYAAECGDPNPFELQEKKRQDKKHLYPPLKSHRLTLPLDSFTIV
jgi:hypothetical protein